MTKTAAATRATRSQLERKIVDLQRRLDEANNVVITPAESLSMLRRVNAEYDKSFKGRAIIKLRGTGLLRDSLRRTSFDMAKRIKKALNEAVDHPQHYGGADNPYEAIKVIEAWALGFCLGNAVKYICRAGKKNTRLEDLKKARWYIDREIQNLGG